MDILTTIQTELKAHKGQTNAFGKYNYRSCEDILEAIKPFLATHKLWINITDEMVMLGDRFYIKATASLKSSEKTLESACGWAREPLSRKGMDESQITGTASSYARKYALNGLLAIDDTKDADTQDNRMQMDTKPINQAHVDGVYDCYKEEIDADKEAPDYERMQKANSRITNDERMAVAKRFGKDKPEGANKQYTTIIKECLNWHPSEDMPE